jgi:pteridine reductase
MTDLQSTDERPVALVTGGAKRVGLAIVERLSAAGYRLIVHANRSAAEAEAVAARLSAAGPPAIALTADIRDEHAIQQLTTAAVERFGRIDALVNSAAIWNRRKLAATTAADVREHWETNTLGTFLCCQQVGAVMIDQPQGGAIVNLGDWAVVRPYLDFAAYFPSKGAIPTLTRTMAVELAARNPRVRVNAILPGPVMLPPDLSAAERQAAIDATLVKREGTPQHVADAALFLIRNDFITGACLPVDGGRSVFSGSFERDG